MIKHSPGKFFKEKPYSIIITLSDCFTAHLCDECGRAFVLEQHLESHKLSHKEPTQKCPQCPYRTRLEQTMRRHITRRHLEITKFLTCHDCGKKFDGTVNFYRHRSNKLSLECAKMNCFDLRRLNNCHLFYL